MKNFLYFIMLFTFSQKLMAMSVGEAFDKFYDDPTIDFNHCGKNIQNFLSFLKDENVLYKSGYVVSLHEGMGLINHFDARWGRQEKYKNGLDYFRSNWYFHVFVVIDGVAYDFSQAGRKAQSLKMYLQSAYIPKDTTESIFLLGELNKDKIKDHFLNLTLKLYDLDNYRKDLGPVMYEGAFIELFHDFSTEIPRLNNKIIFDDLIINSNKSLTFFGPKLITKEGIFPLLGYNKDICQTIGLMGSFNSLTKYKISNKVKALKLSTKLKSINYIFSSSYRIKETNEKVDRDLFHYVTEVTCGNLKNLIQ